MWAAPEGEVGFWNSGHRVVEEVDSDDSDPQGVSLANVSGNRRIMGDQHQLAGGRSRKGYAYQPSDGESTEEDDTDQDTEDETQIALRESEEALVQSALARIRKAQAKGRQDVRLNKEELAALERRRKRLQAEAKKKKATASGKGGDSKRRKEKEQRYAVPISHLEGASDDALPQHPSPATLAESQDRLRPPKGLFPPPNSSRSRPRSTSSSLRPQSGHDNVDYQYAQPPPNSRHASDPASRPRSYYAQQYQDDRHRSASSLSRQGLDPFQFQTEDQQRAPYPPSDEQTSEEEDNSDSSDGRGSGTHNLRNRSRGEIVEPAQEPEPDRALKGRKTRSSSTKRKPVPSSSSTSTRRRKGR